jgi:hypothetical protein
MPIPESRFSIRLSELSDDRWPPNKYPPRPAPRPRPLGDTFMVCRPVVKLLINSKSKNFVPVHFAYTYTSDTGKV